MEGNIAWMLTATSLVFLMIPGLGYFYSGMAQTKNALSLIMLCCLSVAIVSVEWFVMGYSLAFSKTGGAFIGNFRNAFLMQVLDQPSVGSADIPDVLFMIYQGMFAAITPALAIGAAAERTRMLPSAVFILLWSVLVYNFVACWTWSPNGWSAKLGGLDFAGGTPVHITSGFAALVFSFMVGRREGHGTEEFKPHNMSNVLLGTALLWFGWFGFNGGSALAANVRAVVACVNTNVAASAGGLTWMVIEYYLVDRKYSAFAFCSGAVAGLVAITPAAGFVDIPSSVMFGMVGSVSCAAAVRLKTVMRFDDAVDVFAIHGVGGLVGSLLTGIFARKAIAGLDPNVSIAGGWLDGNWMQVPYQLADCCAGAAWSSLGTFAILFVMNRIPGLQIRASSESENLGLDLAEIGHPAYFFDNASSTCNTPITGRITKEKQGPIPPIDEEPITIANH
ncbi:ammonium transporter [Entomophthora muscae]|uniref:Ammonium transporter n=1 Tax=Entomophthora muscae TaxID=34485 RepID=A0ACC2TP35_9FUNG|nr:ammonium transporter [Entomophthora muscae]